METITQVKQQLDTLLLELEQRETATAHAMETLTLDDRVRAAWAEATMAERFRVLALIDAQIGQLNGAGMKHHPAAHVARGGDRWLIRCFRRWQTRTA
jgi:hypothetical protein